MHITLPYIVALSSTLGQVTVQSQEASFVTVIWSITGKENVALGLVPSKGGAAGGISDHDPN